jgi:hypothetical protein
MDTRKLLTLIAALSILISTTEAQRLNSFFKTYEKDCRFESVSVGKFLLTLPLVFGNLSHDEREFISCIKQVNILTSSNALDSEFSTTVLNDLNKIIYQENYENLVEVRDKGEKVKFFGHFLENKNSDLLVVVNDNKEMNIIWINGKMSRMMIEKFHDQLVNNSSNILNNLH